jgi:hypothetical protein
LLLGISVLSGRVVLGTAVECVVNDRFICKRQHTVSII